MYCLNLFLDRPLYNIIVVYKGHICVDKAWYAFTCIFLKTIKFISLQKKNQTYA